MIKIQICPECCKKADAVGFDYNRDKIVFCCYKCNNKFFLENNILVMWHDDRVWSVLNYLTAKEEEKKTKKTKN